MRQFMQPRKAKGERAATLSGLMGLLCVSPRVARSSQPWAERCNPFGIERHGPSPQKLVALGFQTFCAIMLLGLGLCCGQAQGLVGYWKFDEGKTRVAADSSGNGNNGALKGSGGPTWISGVLSNALRFDGADEYVNVPNSASLGISGDITVAAWIKREEPLAYDGVVAKTDGVNV